MTPREPVEPITRTLVRSAHALSPCHLDTKVLQRSRELLLDYLGVAIAGSLTESSQALRRTLAKAAPSGPSTVIGTALRTSPEYAALANGAAAHGVELDDTHQAGSIHLGVVMFSAAIALSEAIEGIGAGAFFAAIAAGYEVAARLGMALQPREHYALGFHPTSTCGVFGAAVTAGKLLGLSEEELLSAVGIAGSMAAGSLEFLADGSWTKRLHPGLAAQNGILAARLAAEGYRGPATILEGRDGFLHSYSRDARSELVARGLGEGFELLRTSIKPHACCRYMQAPIDALIALANEHDIRPEQVERTEVAVLEAGWPLVCEPQERKYAPASIVDAQFSMPFGAAVALACRKAGLDQFTPEYFESPDIRNLMRKVVMTKDRRIEQNFPVEWASMVDVCLTNGAVLSKHVRFPKGDPENPLTWQEVADKFISLATRVFPLQRCDEIVQRVAMLGVGAGESSAAPIQSAVLRDLWQSTRT